MLRCGCSSSCQIGTSSAVEMLRTRRVFTLYPPLANGAYAVTSSIGVTSAEPSAIDGTSGSGLVIPFFRAVAMTRGIVTA